MFRTGSLANAFVRRAGFNTSVVRSPFDRGVPVPLTQTQLARAIADRADISRAEAKRVLAALEEIVLEELGNAQKVRIGGLVQLTVRVKPAQKPRKGPEPGDRRGDHDRGQARRRRPSRASAREGQGRAADRAEGPPTTRRLTPHTAGGPGGEARPEGAESSRVSDTERRQTSRR
jgi:DNA-binding protein HU-beta